MKKSTKRFVPYAKRRAWDLAYRRRIAAEMRARGLLAVLREEFGSDVTPDSFLERVAGRAKLRVTRAGYLYWLWRGCCRVPLHRAAATLMLGRDLRPGEHVHHRDGNTQNNHPSNLGVLRGVEEHRLHHGACGNGWGEWRYGAGPNRGRLVRRVVMERLLARALKPGEVVVSVAQGYVPLPSRDLRVLPRGEHLAFYAMARKAGLKAAVAAWFPGGGLCGTRPQRAPQRVGPAAATSRRWLRRAW